MTNDKDGAALLREGPAPIPNTRLQCFGCKHLETEDWREPSGDGETFDRGTSADCKAIPGGQNIGVYWSRTNDAPKWCPFLPALKSHGQAFDAAGVREACAKVAKNELVDVFEDSPEIDTVCNSVVREIVNNIRALPIPEAPASVEPVAVQPIATVPIGEYVLFHFDGPFNDTECPGVSVGKKCADGRYWLTAIWASSTSHHDPVGWSPIPQSSRPEPDTIGSRSPGFGGGDLREALTDMCAAMEYWAGCDEGCSEDEAASEIMSSGGAWPATSYEQARKALAALSHDQRGGSGE